SQSRGERQPDLAVHLNLADTFVVIFNRVFDGDDLERLLFDFVESAIKSRGLARAGRPRHQDDAVRPIDHLPERVVSVRQHADVGQVEDHPAFVEESKDNSLAMNHRDDGDADIDLAVVDAHFDATVLGQALFGDVEPRHDLEPANDGGLEAIDLRWQRLRLQHAVDAIAN